MPTEFQRFVGPRPFERREAPLFFGRAHEAAELVSLIVAHAAVLLYSQSGAGKTSLINAALTPLLEREGFEVLPTARVRGDLPDGTSDSDGGIRNVYVFNVLAGWGASGAAADADGERTLAAHLKTRPPQLDADGEPRPRVILFDQFEELFTFYAEHVADRRGFFEQVRDALQADRFLRVVFAMREEYLAELAPYAALMPEQLRTRVRLERLRGPAALEAVIGPLKDSRLSFAPGVPEKLVNELLQVNVGSRSQPVRGEYVEPVQLQVVCERLCRGLPPEVTVIDDSHLRAFGDVNEALATFYEESLRDTQRATRVSIGALRKWFREMLITSEGTRDAIRMGQTETGNMPNRAVFELEKLHLIRGEERGGRGRWYELTHDRFIAPIRASNQKAREHLGLLRRVAFGICVVSLAVTCLMLNEARKTNKEKAARAEKSVQANKEKARRAEESAAATAAGNTLAENGRHQEAISKFNEAIQLNARNAEAHVKAGDSHYALGESDQAIAHYQQALEITPSASVHLNLGATYLFALKDFDKARAEFEKAIALEPDSPKPHSALGDLETERVKTSNGTNYQSAKPHYETAIRKDPKWPGGYLGLGYLHLYEGEVGAAIATFQRATEQLAGEGSARSHLAFGEALFWKGDFDRALAECAFGVGLASTEPAAYRRWVEMVGRIRMADVYYLKRRFDLAEMELMPALQIAKGMGYKDVIAQSCTTLASVALRQGKKKDAAQWILQAVEATPDYHSHLFLGGIIFEMFGKSPESRQFWERGLKACRSTDPVERMNGVIYNVALGNPGTAKAMEDILHELLKKEPPPLGMMISASDVMDLLITYGKDSPDRKKIRELLDGAIRAAAERDGKK